MSNLNANCKYDFKNDLALKEMCSNPTAISRIGEKKATDKI